MSAPIALFPLGHKLPPFHVLHLLKAIGFDLSTLAPSNPSLFYTLYTLVIPESISYGIKTDDKGVTTYIMFKGVQVVTFTATVTSLVTDEECKSYELIIEVLKIKSLLSPPGGLPLNDLKEDPRYDALKAQLDSIQLELQELKQQLPTSTPESQWRATSVSWQYSLTSMILRMEKIINKTSFSMYDRRDLSDYIQNCKNNRAEHIEEHEVYLYKDPRKRRIYGMFPRWETTYEGLENYKSNESCCSIM